VVVNVSLSGPELDYDVGATLLGQTFRLVRRGTSGDVAAAVGVVEQWREVASAFAISGVREARAVGLFSGDDAEVDEIRAACDEVPVTDGELLTDVLQEWAIRTVQAQLPGYFTNARTLVLGKATTSAPPRSSRSSPPTSSTPTPSATSTTSPCGPASPRWGWPSTRRACPCVWSPAACGGDWSPRRSGSPTSWPVAPPATATWWWRRTTS
jgi:hypothetical protein